MRAARNGRERRRHLTLSRLQRWTPCRVSQHRGAACLPCPRLSCACGPCCFVRCFTKSCAALQQHKRSLLLAGACSGAHAPPPPGTSCRPWLPPRAHPSCRRPAAHAAAGAHRLPHLHRPCGACARPAAVHSGQVRCWAQFAAVHALHGGTPAPPLARPALGGMARHRRRCEPLQRRRHCVSPAAPWCLGSPIRAAAHLHRPAGTPLVQALPGGQGRGR